MSSNAEESNSEEGNSKDKRESHKEVERRRRNKMAVYVNDLSEFLIKKKYLTKRPEKLNILQSASNQLREYSERHFHHFFLKPSELNELIDDATKGFKLEVDCTTGIIKKYTCNIESQRSNENCIGTNIFEHVHTEDHGILGEQLLQNKTSKFLDLKTGTVRKGDSLPPYRAAMSCKRNFKCRMKFSPHGYSIVHWNGFVANCDTDSSSILKLFGKVISVNLMSQSNQDTFETVLALNVVIANATGNMWNELGYCTKLIIGLNFLQFIHPYDQHKFICYFQSLSQNNANAYPITYRVQGFNGQFVLVNCEGKPIVNPITKNVKFIVFKQWKEVEPVQESLVNVDENPVNANVPVPQPVQEAAASNSTNNYSNPDYVNPTVNTQYTQRYQNPHDQYQYQMTSQHANVQNDYYEPHQQFGYNQMYGHQTMASPTHVLQSPTQLIHSPIQMTPSPIKPSANQYEVQDVYNVHNMYNGQIYENSNNKFYPQVQQQEQYEENLASVYSNHSTDYTYSDINRIMPTIQNICAPLNALESFNYIE